MERQMDGRTDGGDYNIAFAFLKKRGDTKCNNYHMHLSILFFNMLVGVNGNYHRGCFGSFGCHIWSAMFEYLNDIISIRHVCWSYWFCLAMLYEGQSKITEPYLITF